MHLWSCSFLAGAVGIEGQSIKHEGLINRPQDSDQALLIHCNVPNHTLSTNDGNKHSQQAMKSFFLFSALSMLIAEHSGVKCKCSDLTPPSNDGNFLIKNLCSKCPQKFAKSPRLFKTYLKIQMILQLRASLDTQGKMLFPGKGKR